MMFSEAGELTQEEQESILLAKSFKQLVDMPAWKTILDFLEELIEQTREDMLGELSGNRERREFLLSRWQQRETVKRALVQLVESYGQEFEQLVRQLTEETDEHPDPNA